MDYDFLNNKKSDTTYGWHGYRAGISLYYHHWTQAQEFAYFLLSVYIIYSILNAAYRMLHIIWFYRTQHFANQGKGRIVGN